jgi:hypothetical protein
VKKFASIEEKRAYASAAMRKYYAANKDRINARARARARRASPGTDPTRARTIALCRARVMARRAARELEYDNAAYLE